ncbi:MAG: hypothetical protein ACLUEK_09745 [Oscillospiraceae bacterium]
MYLNFKPYICKMRSHEIALAFDRRIRELGGDSGTTPRSRRST